MAEIKRKWTESCFSVETYEMGDVCLCVYVYVYIVLLTTHDHRWINEMINNNGAKYFFLSFDVFHFSFLFFYVKDIASYWRSWIRQNKPAKATAVAPATEEALLFRGAGGWKLASAGEQVGL